MSPLQWHDVRLRMAIRCARPIVVGALLLLFYGIVGSIDFDSATLLASAAPK